MRLYSEYKRRAVVPLAGITLTLYFFLFYLPLARKADALNEPLNTSWKQLANSLGKTNANRLDFVLITNQLAETRQALDLFQDSRTRAAARLELGPILRGHLETPFELVEFENARSEKMDELIRKTKELKMGLDPAVLRGFPEHTADIRQPALLWAELSMASDLLDAAVLCKATGLHYLDTSSTSTGEPVSRWNEVTIEFEFTAAATNAARLLQTLPLRAPEVKALGLPEADPEKVPLLLDRLVIKRVAPEKPDEVRTWVRLAGFIPKE